MNFNRVAPIAINQLDRLMRFVQEAPEHISKIGVSPIAIAVVIAYLYLVFRTPSVRPV